MVLYKLLARYVSIDLLLWGFCFNVFLGIFRVNVFGDVCLCDLSCVSYFDFSLYRLDVVCC